MPPAPEATVQAYSDLLERLRDRTVAATLVAWDALGSYNEDDVTRYLATVVPIVTAGQRQTATMTAGYVRRMIQTAGATPADVTVDPDRAVGAAVRKGTEPGEVYRRSFVTVWAALKADVPWSVAVARGRLRAGQTAAADISFAARQAAQDAMAGQPDIVGYRRVLGPGINCGRCIAASTQRYRTGDLMPIHPPSCKCKVAPVVGDHDPGLAINRQRLDQLKAEMRDRKITFSKKDQHRLGHIRWDVTDEIPADMKVRVVEHGEHGPVLVDADHAFTAAGDIAA